MEYILMNQRTPVLLLEIDEITGGITAIKEHFQLSHLPVGVLGQDGTPERAPLVAWWQARGIPISRSGLRDALDLLGVASSVMLLYKCYGLSLSDQYWMNPTQQPLSWEDINFFDNSFSEDIGNALFGTLRDTQTIDWLSPCSTSDGWLKKKWKIADGQRVLLKGGSGSLRQEPLNEQVVSLLLKKLQIPHVPYTVAWENDEPYSLCPNFVTRETELVPMASIFKVLPRNPDEPLMQHILHCCNTLGIPNVRPFLVQMLTVDALVANTDRHLSNFGALRNVETLEWLGMAPVYDNGTSLWHSLPTADIGPDAPVMCRPFAKTHAAQLRLLNTNFAWLDFDALRNVPQEVAQIFSTSRYLDAPRVEAICRSLGDNIERLHTLQRERRSKENAR